MELSAQYRALRQEIQEAVNRVLDRGWFILGDNVRAFEEEFSGYVGASHGVGVGSGTEALHLALVACGVQPGDEVITVPNTAVPTVSAISFARATPVFVDIDPQSYNMDPALLEGAITPKTRAVIPVHLFGQAADMDPILAIARQHDVKVVEDCAQAHGALYRGKKVGPFGDVGCFSFYPSKNLGAYGDGGMIVTNDAATAEKCRLLRNYGEKRRYHHAIVGFNSRLDEIQAAVLRVKLKRLDEWNAARRERAGVYDRLLGNSGAETPREMAYGRHVFHLYVVRSSQRDELQSFLASHGVGTLIHYPIPVHLQEAYLDLGIKPGSFPVAERYASEILSLPLYPELSAASVERVAALVKEFHRG
ncbi:MAG: DegT/DnrJ/EryC1/StrS family aminotransferase [Chloroflexi bacterium]|nr:DegT/DnrJ/EryC1/StrS family aminotransferase [Chloroflexota bacterium]